MAKKEYFIDVNGNKQGAFTFDELIKKDIYDTSLIWKAGWSDWKFAKDCEELNEYFIVSPPPTPNERIKKLEKDISIRTLKLWPRKIIMTIVIVVIALILVALIGAIHDQSGRYGLRAHEGAGIIGIILCAIILIRKLWIGDKQGTQDQIYHGDQSLKDGSKYEGEMVNGLRHGKGKFIFNWDFC